MSIATPKAADTTFGVHPPGFRLPATTRVGSVRLAVSTSQTRSILLGGDRVGRVGPGRRSREVGRSRFPIVLLELEELPGSSPDRSPDAPRPLPYSVSPAQPFRTSAALCNICVARIFNSVRATISTAKRSILQDPDGLSVEVYADRPRSEWLVENGELLTAVDPVRFETFPAVAAESWHGAPAGTTMGHVHFYVGDLEQAKKFYHSGLGLDITTWRYPGALFTSAGGYHHHVGLNVWVATLPVLQ